MICKHRTSEPGTPGGLHPLGSFVTLFSNVKNKILLFMDKSILVSIRLDADLLERIDKFSQGYRSWSRSSIIRDILFCVFQTANEETLKKMVCFVPYATETWLTEFKKLDVLQTPR